MKSAFWTANQPGYLRKSASSVIHTAATAASTAAPPTSTCHDLAPSRGAERRMPSAVQPGNANGLVLQATRVERIAGIASTVHGDPRSAQACPPCPPRPPRDPTG